MKNFLKTLLVTITLLIATCAGTLHLLKDHIVCDEDNDAVEYAMSISQERLSKLYYDMERYSTKDDIPDRGYAAYKDDAFVPIEFADLVVATIRPDYGKIVVKSCMDHGIDLSFEGVGKFKEYDKARRIVLSWGEHTVGSQVLWLEE